MTQTKVPYNAEALEFELRAIKTTDSIWSRAERAVKKIRKSPATFIDTDTGRLGVSSDDGCLFIDYYGEGRGGYPWIDPRLDTWAKEKGYFWEWRDPATIVLCD